MMESKLVLRGHLLAALDAVDAVEADDSAVNVLGAKVESLEKRIKYLETLFSEIGMNPDSRWSVTDIAGIRKAVAEATIPF